MTRRVVLIAMVVLITIAAVQSFIHILSGDGLSTLDGFLVAVFVPLAAWLAQSFCTLTAGALLIASARLRGWRALPRDMAADVAAGLDPALPRVALIMPVYNEDSRRVFAGIGAMRDALRDLGVGARFDIFVLADTTDPDKWMAEEEAWAAERARNAEAPALYYRRRLRNTRRKTGNIAEFVERYGGAYGSMVVLDADSLMAAEAIWALVRRLDASPETALIQAPPKLILGETVFARMLQVAGDLYGPLSAAGIAYWAGGEGNYWGHNAIIRVAAFADHCGLPDLPGAAPLGGEILSHDFVEAALLRRAGWRVLVAWDLAGSWEEPPPTLQDFMVRDRRWCQGNMQHGKIVTARGLHPASRIHMLIGIMAYVTSPLWMIFLVLSGLQAWTLAHTHVAYFRDGLPWPTWPISREGEAALLLAGTLGLLFLPKIWGLLLVLTDGPARRARGGLGRILAGFLVENVISALIAPIMMVRHSQFVFSILSGGKVDWKPQSRQANQSAWRAEFRTYRDIIVLGVAALGFVLWMAPGLGWWLSPVLAGMILAPLLSRFLAGETWGRSILRIPEDATPPAVVARMEELMETLPAPLPPEQVFSRIVLDPDINARHRALLTAHGESPTAAPLDRDRAVAACVHLGPDKVTAAERKVLLESAETLEQLHVACWARRLETAPGTA